MAARRIGFVALVAVVAAALLAWLLASSPPEPVAPFSPPSPPASSAVASNASKVDMVAAGGDSALRRVPGACAVLFENGEAHLSDRGIAAAVLDTFDPIAMSTQTARGDADDAFTVASCRGSRAIARPRTDLPRGKVSVMTSLLTGPSELADDAGLGGSVVARVIVGEQPGPCARAKGFLAIATLRGPRLDIDALSEWEGPCGSMEPLSIMRVGSEIALLEEDGDSGEESTSAAWVRVWLRRPNGTLVHAGNVQTNVEDENEHRSMTAELASSPRGIVAHETWTTDAPDAAQRVVDRPYVLEGARLR